MLVFTVNNDKVVPDEKLLMIEEFTKIIAYGKKVKKPDLANKMLLYVYWCCDLSQGNPFKDTDLRQKETQAFMRAFQPIGITKLDDIQQNLIDDAISAYNFFNETSIERAVSSYDIKIDEIRTFLDNTHPEMHLVTDEDGNPSKYIANDKIIESFAKQLKDMTVYKLHALETAKKVENVGRVRAGKTSSLIERGSFRRG